MPTDAFYDATSKSALNRGFETWVVGDTCGTGDPKVYERTVESWGRYYQWVDKTED